MIFNFIFNARKSMLIHEKVAMRDVLKKRRRQLMLAAALS